MTSMCRVTLLIGFTVIAGGLSTPAFSQGSRSPRNSAAPPSRPAPPPTQPGSTAGTPPGTAAPPPGSVPPSATSPPFETPAARDTAPRSGKDAPEGYRIGPEDILDISVWKSAELTRTVAVRPDGKISLPLLNDIQAANMTPMQLRETLARSYAEYVSSPEVSVIVREIHSAKVSVVGTVKTPGRYELKSHATVLEVLALAGGLTDFAKRDRIVVFRPKGTGWSKLPFNYAKVLAEWDTRENFPLEPGDIVVVP